MPSVLVTSFSLWVFFQISGNKKAVSWIVYNSKFSVWTYSLTVSLGLSPRVCKSASVAGRVMMCGRSFYLNKVFSNELNCRISWPLLDLLAWWWNPWLCPKKKGKICLFSSLLQKFVCPFLRLVCILFPSGTPILPFSRAVCLGHTKFCTSRSVFCLNSGQ